MNISPRFETIWNSVDDFVVPRETMKWCPYARKFAEWSASLISVSQEPSLVEVNQAKVLLLDKYFEWRSHVPKSHRNRVGPGGHRCIYHVFEQTYEKLKVIELSLTPPLLFLPPPPPPPPPTPQIAGLFLGGLDG
jgi:hypothetical protein